MSVVTATILSEGQALAPTCEVVAIDIRREVDRLPTATLTLVDGDQATREFTVSRAATFALGRKIEIKLRYEGESTPDWTVFKGCVVRHGLEVGLGQSLLHVELKDAAVGLTLGRRSRVFRDKKDAEVLKTLIQEAGLKAGKLDTTALKHPELVQYDCTDWDFALARADANGLHAVVEDGTVSFRAIELTGSASKRFELGLDEVFDLEVEANGTSQLKGWEGFAWNVKDQKATAVAKAKSFSLKQGNFKSDSVASALGARPETIAHVVAVDPQEIQAGLDARLRRNRLAFVRGRIAVRGSGTFRLLDLIELAGLGERFNGATAVTGLRHRVDHAGWRTDLQFGLPADPFARRTADLQAMPAAGLLPAVSGLQIGVVSKFEADPDKQLRVKVQIPGLGSEAGALWARLAAPEAGKDRGFYFRPEPGDEVVVGFLNDDPRQPVILGALFSSKNTVPKAFEAPAEKNPHKGLVTRGGTTVHFLDADKPSLRIETPAHQTVVLDDVKQLIQLKDQHGNEITMDSNGIKLKSPKNLVLEITGKVDIDAKGNVTIKGAAVDVQ